MQNINDTYYNIPINHSVLSGLLTDVKFPKDKITRLADSGKVIRVKNGLYVITDKSGEADVSKELIANHLYGVSYVSFETALAYYGMIPEKVYAVRSMTTKRAKTFTTPFGDFEYKTASADYFSVGLRQEIVEDKYAFLIASPTKAVCDMIVATPNLRLQSVKAMRNYLTENLRIEEEILGTLDREVVRRCVEVGKKKEGLECLLKFLELK